MTRTHAETTGRIRYTGRSWEIAATETGPACVYEREHDHDLHAYEVEHLGTCIGIIYPDTLDDQEQLTDDLDHAERYISPGGSPAAPIGWDDGLGGTIGYDANGGGALSLYTNQDIDDAAGNLIAAGWTAADIRADGLDDTSDKLAELLAAKIEAIEDETAAL